MFCLSCGCSSECVKITEVQGKLVYLGGSGGSSIFTELGQESMGKWIINQYLHRPELSISGAWTEEEDCVQFM